ncbi:MAG TPA: energy transducer TonB [Candidatus Elarobacter sp.]|nr:energy transducer TonB [Candidatus Elarobacter sp.]
MRRQAAKGTQKTGRPAFRAGVLPVMRFAILLVCIAASAVPQEPRLNWIVFKDPVYPQMARIAHIVGRVTLEIIVHPDGSVTIGNAVGHPILVEGAKDSVQKSKLSCEGCGAEPHSFTIVYEFGFADPLPPPARIVSHPAIRRQRERSIRCVYLWRCGTEWIY